MRIRCPATIVLALFFAAVMVGHDHIRAEPPPAAKNSGKCLAQPRKKSRPAITISKETTCITAPLRNDGYVDYVGALNQRDSQGVTPEHNAAELFWKATGPGKIAANSRQKYFQLLGIPPLPEKGLYLVPWRRYIAGLAEAKRPTGTLPNEEQRKELCQLDLQKSTAETRPWSAREFPRLAEWLASNEKPLALLIEASKRPRCYFPLVGDNLMATLPLPEFSQSREAAKALTVRAMLRIQQGQTDQAWEDLLACQRLARLLRQGPSLVVDLLGVSVEGIACAGEQHLLQSVRLTAAQAARMRANLGRMSAFTNMADRIDRGERFYLLDAIAVFTRGPLPGVDVIHMMDLFSKPPNCWQDLLDRVPSWIYDWDRILRLDNYWYDRMADAYRKSIRSERQRAMDAIRSRISHGMEVEKDWKAFGISILASPRQATSDRLSYILLGSLPTTVSMVADAEDRTVMQLDLIGIGFALAAYRADHGSYPAKLTDLAPRYLGKIPLDIFIAAPLHYKRHGVGYLLYSVGPNGKDDGGKGRDDNCKAGDDFDDLAVRVLAAAAKN